MAFGHDPVVVVAGHQFAGIQRACHRRLAAGQMLLELQHIAAHGLGCQSYQQPVGLQQGGQSAGAMFQHAPQQRQGLAQALATLVQRHAGPQQFDQFFAGVVTPGRQCQACQQRRHRPAGPAGHGDVAMAQLHPAQQVKLPGADGRRRGELLRCLRRLRKGRGLSVAIHARSLAMPFRVGCGGLVRRVTNDYGRRQLAGSGAEPEPGAQGQCVTDARRRVAPPQPSTASPASNIAQLLVSGTGLTSSVTIRLTLLAP